MINFRNAKIAIVGSGPTCIYTLKGLIRSKTPISLTIFEAHAEAGKGTPYYPLTNDRAMLANIASIEFPPVVETLVHWLQRQDDTTLERLGTTRALIGEREFYPRILIGEYLNDQFWHLVKLGIANGHSIDVKSSSRVTDITLQGHAIELRVKHGKDDAISLAFDQVVLATGHDWPETTETSPGYFISPWPASDLERIGNCAVGVLGTSLSGIDAVVSVATSHGTFLLDENDRLRYHLGEGHDEFSLTMMSRKGLLPEADFYCPYPYEPLVICTEEAMDTLVAKGPSRLLDKAFDLFRSELVLADPAYAARIGLATATVETIADRYFAEREAADPFVWAANNLAQAENDKKLKRTIPWRYAILRMHEVIARVVRHLDETDLKRFHKHFKVVFVDDYATVPHQSIQRLLALGNAGLLSVRALGDDYDIRKNDPEPGVTVTSQAKENSFGAFIDATGQHPLSARDLPFPSLKTMLKAALTPSAGALMESPLEGVRTGGIDLDEVFRPRVGGGVSNRLYCVAIAFLLHKLPFVQGITSSQELGEAVSNAIVADIDREHAPDILPGTLAILDRT